MRTNLPAAGAALVLAACAANTSAAGRQQTEYERLARECQDRGGILMPIPGANSANTAANYACEVRGPVTRSN